MTNEELYLEVWKKARESVEHFDKILGDFRKIIFTFNGIIISSGFALYTEHSSRYTLFFLACNVLGFTNILIWLLEKHYHRYLFTSALVAMNIERDLFRGNQRKALTSLLNRARKVDIEWEFNKISQISRFIRSYDLLYILPILVCCITNFILAHMSSKPSPNPCTFWLWLFSCILILLYSFVVYAVLRYDYLFIRKRLVINN